MIEYSPELEEAYNKARAIIADPAKWTQEDYARDAEGNGVDGTDPNAVCWCSLGVMQKVASEYDGNVQGPSFNTYNNLRWAMTFILNDAIFNLTGNPDEKPATYNDGHDHAEVVKAWDMGAEILVTMRPKPEE